MQLAGHFKQFQYRISFSDLVSLEPFSDTCSLPRVFSVAARNITNPHTTGARAVNVADTLREGRILGL
jgi:hypothetical protein